MNIYGLSERENYAIDYGAINQSELLNKFKEAVEKDLDQILKSIKKTHQ